MSPYAKESLKVPAHRTFGSLLLVGYIDRGCCKEQEIAQFSVF